MRQISFTVPYPMQYFFSICYMGRTPFSPSWYYINKLGQIESVQSLMTSEDISPNITDQSVSFINPMTALTSDLRAGVSLMSY